ncbi:free fatty acid receptor 3 [Alosa alosa]|uniref:free fatty acid receptor 3 n=1 Tax=Alosa sapidissima TaxID=34773 RepID=UPI001C096E09|nr:free fatty acid receptor 3 [Alosa sapidissima]XP_048086262.1 free fatty acid receptor 3 [Alosa alosa]
MVAAEDFVSLGVYSFTFVLGLPSNLLVLFVYVQKARKHGATPSVVYALNLCMANLALVVWMPVKALETVLQGWALPAAICPIYSFFLFSSIYGSCLFLTAVTVGRYLSIAFPITYKLHRHARLSCVISAILWALVLLHLSLGLVVEQGGYFVSPVSDGNSSRGSGLACFENFTETQLELLLPLRLEMALLLFLLPLLITAFCTLRCVALVGRSKLPAGGKRRVLAIACSTLAVFVVCYAPYNASHVVGYVLNQSVSWRREAMLTSSCNIFLEPMVMLMLSTTGPRGLCACLRDGGGGGGGGTRQRSSQTNAHPTGPPAAVRQMSGSQTVAQRPTSPVSQPPDLTSPEKPPGRLMNKHLP